MSNDAIVNNDVSAEIDTAGEQDPGAQATAQAPLPRDLALKEIARAHEESIGLAHDDDDDDGDGDNKASAAHEGAPDPLAELGFYKNPKGELVTKVKINGEEREIPASQFKSFVQKDLAGDLKLQQASERERQLQQKEQQLQQKEQQLRQTMTAPKKPSEEDAKKTRESIKVALERVYDGDLEAATEQLMAVVMERGNATPTAEELMPLIESTVMSTAQKQEQSRQLAAWNQSVDDGNRDLAKNHPEIYKDPKLFDLVNAETARMLEERENGNPEFIKLMPKDIIAKAADEVQSWLGIKRGKPDATPGNSRDTRKANLRPMVQGQDKVRRPTPKAEPDMSTNAVIERMRQSRATANNRGA